MKQPGYNRKWAQGGEVSWYDKKKEGKSGKRKINKWIYRAMRALLY